MSVANYLYPRKLKATHSRYEISYDDYEKEITPEVELEVSYEEFTLEQKYSMIVDICKDDGFIGFDIYYGYDKNDLSKIYYCDSYLVDYDEIFEKWIKDNLEEGNIKWV